MLANIKERLNDVSATSTPSTAVFHRGDLTATIMAGAVTWYVRFERNGVDFVMPPLAVDTHTPATARTVAKTILGFFDPALSVPESKP